MNIKVMLLRSGGDRKPMVPVLHVPYTEDSRHMFSIRMGHGQGTKPHQWGHIANSEYGRRLYTPNLDWIV